MTIYQPTLTEEVHDALASNQPVVALESTIITHGMPFPVNLETALAVEAAVRENGAVPATIAVIDGMLKVGLSSNDLERMAHSEGIYKASSRDLAALMVRGASAGTTISATMRAADLAGIDILATGGSGGVHRGANETFDISADLMELANTGTAVFCAGVKSILDIGKTLEYLETLRVPIIAFGTDEFPAFFTRSSGFRADHRLDTPQDIARAIHLHHELNSGTGLLIVNPISEEESLDRNVLDDIINSAILKAEAAGISRKELTPYLLDHVNQLSEGKSLIANVALIKSNAALAAKTAVALKAMISSE